MINMDIREKNIVYDWMRDSFFPRTYGYFDINGFFHRDKIISFEPISTVRDSYLSLFSEEQIEKEMLDTFYLDIDAHNGESLEDRRATVLDAFVDLGINLFTRCYYTGRGFAYFLDFTEPVSSSYFKKASRYLIGYLELGDVVDVSVIGDYNRMARVPSTFNTKSNSWMVEIPQDISIRTAKENSTNKIHKFWRGNKVNFKKLMAEIGFKEETEEKKRNITKFGKIPETEYPPCIQKSINDLFLTGELDHRERIHFASFMIMNEEKDKAHEIIKTAGDYKESITSYQLDYLEKKPAMFSCKNVPKTICPFAGEEEMKKCPYFPDIMITFGGRGN